MKTKILCFFFLIVAGASSYLFPSANSNSFFKQIINKSELLFYGRFAEVVEITGNEDSLVTAFHTDLTWVHAMGQWKGNLDLDFYIMQELSPKARVFDAFSPPPLLLKDISYKLSYAKENFDFDFHFGLFAPVINQFPMTSYYLPFLFKTENNNENESISNVHPYIGYPLVYGYRDQPLLEANLLPYYDNSLYVSLGYKFLLFKLGISNGEFGLDSNSAKTVFTVLDLFLDKDKNYQIGSAAQIGNYGSVYIKETKHFYKLYFYHNKKQNPKNITWGLETTLLLHGVQRPNEIFYKSDLVDDYDYGDGIFEPGSVYNDGSYDDSSQINTHTLYGLGGLLYLRLPQLFLSALSLETHFSFYDPNLLDEEKDYYSLKFRYFLRLVYAVNPQFKILISNAYTYDRYYLNNSQFYDYEPRASHPIIDNDFFFGFAVSVF